MLNTITPRWGEFTCADCALRQPNTKECHYRAPTPKEFERINDLYLVQWPQMGAGDYCYEGYAATKRLREGGRRQ